MVGLYRLKLVVIKILNDELNNKLQQEESRTSEFDAYAAKAKKSISTLIENGQINQALGFISAYESLCPNDIEIIELKRRISSMAKLN